jgi:hypothetical protein
VEWFVLFSISRGVKGTNEEKPGMRIIQPNCRIQFTDGDIQFITEILGKTEAGRQALVQLLTDPTSRDTVLDDEKLLRALLEHGGCLRVSTHFYFYILVRRVLKDAGIHDTTVADYVAEMMAEFSRTERSRATPAEGPNSLDYFFEMLAALQRADDLTAFYLRSHIGNQSLFMSGLFLERIKHRAERRGSPGLRYYESLGKASFRAAGDHRLARKYELSSVFHTLAEQFEAARRALNDLADRLVSLGDPNVNLPILCGGPDRG